MGRSKALIVACFLSLLGACTTPDQTGPQADVERYQSYFVRQEEYDAFYDQAEDVNIEPTVRGIIAPHHLLVGAPLASLYEAISDQHPSVVVIIGPDHDGVGVSPVVTTDIGYDTPYGTLDIDTQLMAQMTSVPLIEVDRQAFVYEHSINSHTAFIRRTFGNVPILPIMIHGTATLDEAEAVAAKLNAILPDDALVIASVDFSHYVPEWVADYHDQISMSTVDAFDMNGLPKLEVDSPASLATLQMYLTMRGAQTVVYRYHTNSASFSGTPATVETTSHVFRAFADGPKDSTSGIGMLFYGDSMFDRGIEAIAKSKGENYLLDGIAHKENRFFLGSHVTVLNLESPITEAAPTTKDPVVLTSDATLAQSMLDRMNIDVLSFNNNHIDDAGQEGIDDTLSFGRKNGMKVLHPERPCQHFTFNQKTAALCAFDDSRKVIDIDSAVQTIKDHKQDADWVVISIHWGQEYRSAPSDRERSIAKKLIDAGADAIVGHGPHVVQPIERYNGKPVAYSIGNFLFDQLEEGTNVGLILGLYLSDDSVDVFPIPFRNDNGKLRLLPYEEWKGYVEKLMKKAEE